MKRYRFRLEAVLRVRRTEQDVARGLVLAATATAAAEARALDERDRAYAAAASAHGSRSAADFLYEQAHRSALANAVLDQRRRLAQAEQSVETARVAWTAAAARVGALERLDERSRVEHAARGLREDELTVDDLVVSRRGGER